MNRGLLLFYSAALVLGTRLAGAQTISGTVFEDANYGGGSGRSMANAGGTGVSGATVELYTSAGAYVKNTTTGTGGTYSFTGVTTNANYIVRVVNSTVASQRTGGTATGLVPVQTFRTNNGAADTEQVGGKSPELVDSGPYATTTPVTLAFTGQNTSGDNTIFVDNVTLASGGTAATVPNYSFETPSQNGGYSYGSNISGGSWTFSGSSGSGSGIEANGSGFGAPNAPQGTQAGFIQNAGSIQQTLSLASGTYTLTIQAAQRNYGGMAEVVQGAVTIGGTTTTLTFTSSNGTLSSGNIAPTVAQGFATYSTSFTVGAGLSSIVAQSQAPVALAANGSQTGVDFGYNFDTVVNTRDAGQGSLRQFILNANALTSSLSQAGLTAGRETSIFMIPDAKQHNGQVTGLVSGLTGSSGAARAVISVTSAALPALTDASTWVSGLTQTTNIGDTNTGQVGTGGTVGVQAIALSKFNKPEVEVSVTNSLAYGLDLEGANLGVTGIALHGGNLQAGLNTAATNLMVTGNLFGVTALTVADPGGTTYNPAFGVYVRGASYGSVVANLFGYIGNSGLNYSGGQNTTGLKVIRNEFVQSGYRTTGGDAISVGDQAKNGPLLVAYNLITTSNSDGLQFEIGQTGTTTTTTTNGVTTTTNTANVVRNNTFFDNGNGSSSLNRNQLEGAAILYLQRSANGANSGTAPDSIYYNIVNQSQASGVVVGYGQKGVIITRNSTYGNGTSRNSGTGGNLGIDIITQATYYVQSSNSTGATDYGNGDGVTPNTGTTTAAYGQAGMNYPIFTLTQYNTSTSITVTGYVGSAAGQTTFGGSTVDIYFANNLDGNNNGAIVTGDGKSVAHGEGQTYLTTLTAAADGTFSATINAPAGVTFNTTGQSLTATAFLSADGTSEFGPNSLLQAVVVSGFVFEDANYGGGAGRSRTAPNSGVVGRPGATVEVYNKASATSYSLVGTANTDSNGAYSFNVPTGDYVVRTVVPTVTSARGSNNTGKKPVAVQTYVRGDVNRVGGEDPTTAADAAAASTVSVTLTFMGNNPSGLDNTAFIDQVEVLDANGNALATNPTSNNGFENPSVGGYQLGPFTAGWTFVDRNTGIAANNGGFDPNTNAGTQTGFVQFNSSFNQSINLPAGSYSIRFITAQRSNTGRLNNQTVVVQLNGTEIGRITPSSAAYVSFTTNAFSVTGASQSSVPGNSQVAVSVGTTSITDMDFGYNFDTVVNTNDTGMGSLRQFIANSNELSGESSLAQVYTNGSNATTALTTGVESSIFMVPGPNAVPGLRTGLTNALNTNGVAVFTPNAASNGAFIITDANTIIDGTTQTRNANTNAGMLGTGGSVGAAGTTTLAKVNAPEVRIFGTPGQTGSELGLTLSGIGDGVQGIAIQGFGNSGASGTGNASGANIYITGGATSGTFVTGNVIGTPPANTTAFATNGSDPNTANNRTTGSGILLGGFANGATVSSSITNNLIGYNGVSGILNLAPGAANSASRTLLIQGNEIRGNAILDLTGDGVRLGGSNGIVQANLITSNKGSGVDFDGSTGGILVTNNTVSSNGSGGTETSGIRTYGTGSTVSLNSIVNNTDSGVLARPGTGTTSSATVISQNSIGTNGKLGIKLLSTTDAETTGTVLLNDSGDIDGRKNGSSAIGGNSLLNFPVISQATISGNNLLVAGYARPGSLVEFFYAQTNGTTADGSGFGEGPTYLVSRTEGNSSDDTDARTGPYSGIVSGRNQGSDYTNRFTFTIPLSSLPTGFAAGAIITSTATATAGYTSEYSGQVTVVSGPLPVQLVAFTAQTVQNRDALLKWTTASELNNDHFELERSFDGTSFVRIGQVAGQGSKATSTDYTYTDAAAATRAQGQPVYYRLRQVDTDGTATYSPTRSVSFGSAAAATLALLPNPASTATGLDLSALPAAATYQVHLLDATGRQVRQWSLAGGQVQPLTLDAVASGSYLVLVSGIGSDGSALRQVLRLTKE